MPGRLGKAKLRAIGELPARKLVSGGIHTNRTYSDENGSRSNLRIRNFFQLEDVRPSEFVHLNRLHGMLLRCS